MFKITNKSTRSIYIVYNVRSNKEKTEFLIYRYSKWEWVDSWFFEPVDEEVK